MLRKKPGFLDSAMVVGEVQQCKRDNKNPALWDITVKPSCDITKLSNVAVIIMNPQNSGSLGRAETAKTSRREINMRPSPLSTGYHIYIILEN